MPLPKCTNGVWATAVFAWMVLGVASCKTGPTASAVGGGAGAGGTNGGGGASTGAAGTVGPAAGAGGAGTAGTEPASGGAGGGAAVATAGQSGNGGGGGSGSAVANGGTGPGGVAGAGTSAAGGAAGGSSAGGGPADMAGAGSVVAAGVRWIGRVDTATAAGPRFAWSGTGFVARFAGVSLSVRLNNGGPFLFKAVVDGTPRPTFVATTGTSTIDLATGLAPGTHIVALTRQTEGVYGDSQLLGITVGAGALMDPPAAPSRLIEVVGASVSCGYGNLGTSPCGFTFATESHFDTYEAVAARRLAADVSVVAISGRGVYRNFDGTTEGTMPKLYGQVLAGSATPAWDFRTTPQVVVINLGKNDFGVGDPGQAFPMAYLAFIRTLRGRYPNALIVCATGPNLGAAAHAQQVTYVNAVLATLRASGETQVELLDWSEQTAAQEGCDAHPNVAKHILMGDELATLIRTRLGW